MPQLQVYLENCYTGVRHLSARCIGMLSVQATADVMLFVIQNILPMFEASDNETQRQGASEAISSILRSSVYLYIRWNYIQVSYNRMAIGIMDVFSNTEGRNSYQCISLRIIKENAL